MAVFSLALGIGTLFGLLPALQAARVDVNRTLAGGTRGSTASGKSTRTRSTLVAVQVAAAMVLVFGATLPRATAPVHRGSQMSAAGARAAAPAMIEVPAASGAAGWSRGSEA